MATMELHNFIKTLNYPDEDFANTTLDTRLNNICSECDFVDREELDAAQGEQLSQIRDNMAHILWKNQNS